MWLINLWKNQVPLTLPRVSTAIHCDQIKMTNQSQNECLMDCQCSLAPTPPHTHALTWSSSVASWVVSEALQNKWQTSNHWLLKNCAFLLFQQQLKWKSESDPGEKCLKKMSKQKKDREKLGIKKESERTKTRGNIRVTFQSRKELLDWKGFKADAEVQPCRSHWQACYFQLSRI